MKSLKNAGIALTFLLTYLFASTIQAAPERKYDVQVLIFSRITPKALQSQQWPVVSDVNSTTTVDEPQHPAFDLAREKKALQKNPEYTILLDSHWQESWNGENATITIPLSSSNNQSKLHGSMNITLGHYFDVDTKLLLSEPTPLLQKLTPSGFFNHWNQPYFNFQLSENRRMRSNELNYLEHPLLGVLIKIIPIK